ncbi:MAG: hypothetical protein R2716_11360 [Microthrixaceae bacterium]
MSEADPASGRDAPDDPPEGSGRPAGAEPLRDDEVVDSLPEDLNAAEFVGPYTFPNNDRRRIPAAMYILIGIGSIVLWIAVGDSSPLVNSGILAAGAALCAFGVYGMFAGRTLVVDETDALVTASKQVGFAAGHASAQQVWHGGLSRPTWRILLYSAENPPRRRGIVLVDGIDGRVVEWFSEENPEEWTEPGAEHPSG